VAGRCSERSKTSPAEEYVFLAVEGSQFEKKR